MAVNGVPLGDPEEQARRWRALLHADVVDLAVGAPDRDEPADWPPLAAPPTRSRHLEPARVRPWWVRAWAALYRSEAARDVLAALGTLAVTLAFAAAITAVTVLAWSHQ